MKTCLPCVGGYGLFHEDVFALLHRFLEHHRAEPRRRGKNDDVGELDGLLVSVEAKELAVLRHVHALSVGLLQIVERALEAVGMDIRHGDELDRADGVGAERLACRTGTAAAAADHGDLDFIATARGMRIALGSEGAKQGTARHRGRGGFKEVPATERLGENDLGWFIHVK